jgi:hypothetical protein
MPTQPYSGLYWKWNLVTDTGFMLMKGMVSNQSPNEKLLR